MLKKMLKIPCALTEMAYGVLIVIVAFYSSCSSENKKEEVSPKVTIEKTVADYLKNQMKNPDSFKIESIEIRKDTLPPYLTDEMLSIAEDFNEAVDEVDRYKDRSYLWAEEKLEASINFRTQTEILKSAYSVAMESGESVVEYVAYVKYSGTNAMGGTVSNRAIVIVDIDSPNNVLGSFSVDEDFIMQIYAIKLVGTDFKFELKQNRYGKYETDGLPYIEQFIFGGAI